jgi:Family of unknown function (DUF6502)
MATPRKPNAESGTDAALLEALARVLAPAARLAVARGLPFAAVEELFKRAFIRAARDSASVDGAVPTVSAIATASGLTRREVTRLTQDEPAPAAERPTLANQVFTSWRAERSLRGRDGASKPLPRLGPPPSFEALAQAITRDVHPRTLLDELCRLGLARLDETTDRVHLLHNAFVPRDDLVRLMQFLGANVGDHFAAGVANVLDKPGTHLEQALFADDLSEESIDAARKLVHAQWRALTAAIVPELEALIEADSQALQRNRTHRAKRRLRIGMYSFNEDRPHNDKETKE